MLELRVPILILFCFCIAAHGKLQPSSTAPQTLQASMKALSDSTVVNDVTLSGTVHHIAGAEEESGNITVKATSNGDVKTTIAYSGGVQEEIITRSGVENLGVWMDSQGLRHAIASQNLQTDPAWFFPALIVNRLSTATNVSLSSVTDEKGERILVVGVPPAGAKRLVDDTDRARNSQLDINSNTKLPASFSFNVHPDQDIFSDIPVVIIFSDYRHVSGVQVPHHVTKSLNGSIVFDITFQTVSINSGIPNSEFSLQ